MYGGKSGNGTGFSSSVKVFPRHYGYTSARYLSLCICCEKDKVAKPGDLPKRNTLSEIGKRWIKKYLHVFAPLKD